MKKDFGVLRLTFMSVATVAFKLQFFESSEEEAVENTLLKPFESVFHFSRAGAVEHASTLPGGRRNRSLSTPMPSNSSAVDANEASIVSNTIIYNADQFSNSSIVKKLNGYVVALEGAVQDVTKRLQTDIGHAAQLFDNGTDASYSDPGQALGDTLDDAMHAGETGIHQVLTLGVNSTSDYLNDGWNSVSGWFNDTKTAVSDWICGAGESVADWCSGAYDTVASFLKGIEMTFVEIFHIISMVAIMLILLVFVTVGVKVGGVIKKFLFGCKNELLEEQKASTNY